MEKKVSESQKAMDRLMKALEYESSQYEKVSDPKERAKCAAAMSLLADKIQKLEETGDAKRSGNRDFWLKVAGVVTTAGFSAYGVIQTNKNLKLLTAFEDENVIRTTSDKSVASSALKVGEFLDRTGNSVLRIIHF